MARRKTVARPDGWAIDLGFGDRVLIARRSARITQLQLAEAVGVRQSTVDAWEHGSTPRDSGEVARVLGRVLGVSPSWLLGWDGEPAARVGGPAGLLDSRNNVTWLFSPRPGKYPATVAPLRRWAASGRAWG